MNIEELYRQIQEGKLSPEEFRRQVSLEYLDLAGKSVLDTRRELRTGIPEIIYAEYKTARQTEDIARALYAEKGLVLISRSPHTDVLQERLADIGPMHVSEHLLVVGTMPPPRGAVAVLSGGTADHPQAEEAALTLRALGVRPLVYEDRGIAHPTRVIDALRSAMAEGPRAVIAIAGMEASLATFVSSLVPLPVVGVPTSVGYGFKAGETALYSMLASCTPNLTVVNINGGLRAAVVAALIAKA